jgi:hypothetical protein
VAFFTFLNKHLRLGRKHVNVMQGERKATVSAMDVSFLLPVE